MLFTLNLLVLPPPTHCRCKPQMQATINCFLLTRHSPHRAMLLRHCCQTHKCGASSFIYRNSKKSPTPPGLITAQEQYSMRFFCFVFLRTEAVVPRWHQVTFQVALPLERWGGMVAKRLICKSELPQFEWLVLVKPFCFSCNTGIIVTFA